MIAVVLVNNRLLGKTAKNALECCIGITAGTTVGLAVQFSGEPAVQIVVGALVFGFSFYFGNLMDMDTMRKLFGVAYIISESLHACMRMHGENRSLG